MEKQSYSVSWIRGKCIGKGSFGTVNLAFNKSKGAVFAVKSIEPKACGANQIDSLENEIRILRSLSSPHVVQFLGDDVSFELSSSSSATTPYRNLHLEYLPGGTVAEVASPDVDEKTVRSYTWCVVSALRYVHSRGIVHCDVKGRNILVGPNLGSAKLADFGSAVEISGDATYKAPIFPRGSPLWMAPEVIRRESQGPESDVWSLGCTVIEMVTGKPAWEDRGVDTLSRIGFSNELPEMPTQLSELGRDFVEKCLRRDPRQRWSCDQLLQHPFISSASPSMITESSPRCVLDCFSSEFEEEDDDVTETDCCSSNFENLLISAKQRISKLATKSGANWESDGWFVARNSSCETEKELGTSTEYSDLMITQEETAGTSTGYSYSVWIREGMEGRTGWEFLNSGGNDLLWRRVNGSTCRLSGCGEMCGSGWSCRYGSQKVDLAVGRGGLLVRFYFRFCNLLFLLQFLTIFRWNNYIFYSLLLLASISACDYDHYQRCCLELEVNSRIFTGCRGATLIYDCAMSSVSQISI